MIYLLSTNTKSDYDNKCPFNINRRFHIIRDYIADGDMKISKVHTDLNVADPLTKPLPREKHDQHLNAMGVRLLQDVN